MLEWLFWVGSLIVLLVGGLGVVFSKTHTK